ncbi:MAG: hypothetical protein NVS3B26_08030 [Mycobacteriales bacterium]
MEERPTKSVLTRLSTNEHSLYRELVTDGFGERIRLDQERIDWPWVQDRLANEKAD